MKTRVVLEGWSFHTPLRTEDATLSTVPVLVGIAFLHPTEGMTVKYANLPQRPPWLSNFHNLPLGNSFTITG